jgi:hypothetical protein
VLPIVDGTEQTQDTSRHANEQIVVIGTPRLEDEDAFGTIRRQTLGQDATRETPTRYNVIVLLTDNSLFGLFCYIGSVEMSTVSRLVSRKQSNELHFFRPTLRCQNVL